MSDCSRAVTPLIKYSHPHQQCSNSLLSSGNTKKAMTYEPRTEAISPAIGEELDISTKDEQTQLVEKLKRVEAEILQTDLQIARLRKQKAQLEQSNNSAKEDDEQENVCDTKQLSIAKLVYHENRSKAQKAHAKLETFGGSIRDLPIYNQPSDNAIYHLNAAKFVTSFKKSLISCFKERLRSRIKLEESVSEEYDKRMERWLRQIEREDSQPSKRMRDAKTREFFEKQFPELKKARESGERFSRVGQRVARSDAELDEILDGITEREDQDKKVKSYAVIPPMLEEMRSKKPKYINTNGYVEDIVAEYKVYQIMNTWSDEEKDIFRESYLQNPKNFRQIATLTGRKNVANCVQYYYMSKKSENYKQLYKKMQKKRTRSLVRLTQQNTSTTANDSNAEVNKTNGVKTSTDVTASEPMDQSSSDQSGISRPRGTENDPDAKIDETIEAVNPSKDHLPSKDDAICCVCSCEFSEKNQSRNVTRSNHQLYGIGVDSLKPGMRICYSCRFRHISRSCSEEPPLSPQSIPEETSYQMDVDPPVVKGIESDQVNLDPSSNLVNPVKDIPPEVPTPVNFESKNYQRTCVRDIIYQAIEMSFKPKMSESHDNHPKADPVQPESAQLNQLVAQHSISNLTSMKPTNSGLPMLPVPLRPPISNIPPIAEPPNPYQMQLQNKQRQMKLDFNARQQFISQQIQHQQQLQHQILQQRQPIQSQIQPQPQSAPPPQPQPQVIAPMPAAMQAQPVTTMVGSHPLNLCRKYSDSPVVRPQHTSNTPPSHWIKPPPMAHGAKWMPPRTVIENGVLNLSKQSPPVMQPTHQVHPSQLSTQQAQSLQMSHPGPIKEERPDENKEQTNPEVAINPNKRKQETPPKEEPRSPDLTGSPASPCPMVIDESADVRSSPP